MTLGEKIQKLRKEHGLSQEQLAAQLDVSRQAISKWELGESVPDINNVILLSECFQVTTDYLLKNDIATEKQSDKAIEKQSDKAHLENTATKNIAVIISSAMIVIGLIVGWARGSTDGAKLEYLPFQLIAPGIIIQILGIALYEIYNAKSDAKTRSIKRYWFYGINCWFLTLLPIIFIVGRFFRYVVGSYNGIVPYFCMLALYIAISSVISLLCFFKFKSRK